MPKLNSFSRQIRLLTYQERLVQARVEKTRLALEIRNLARNIKRLKGA